MSKPQKRRAGDLAPNLELWAALDEGRILTEVLTDFYKEVYADPQLAHFFHGVTIERVREKQYNFLYAILSGEPVYFGERPRNAHHWMVISNDLFDYREDMLARHFANHGVADEHVQHIRRISEAFRKQIVKDEPIPKRFAGRELPLEGYDSIVLAIGSLCDGCQGEMHEGDKAQYHVRTGQTYCQACMPEGSTEPNVAKVV
ncbi:MAG: group 1 truncated hemoglobin [Gammaproteobacteria bacterium]|nr:group 1 truncated hemoglobin [Gammaproteobacteria bacterium]